MDDTKKVILITGCSSGFGLLTAARLASCGHFVFASMRNLSKSGPLLEEVKKRNAHLEVIPLDVCNTESIKKAVQIIKEKVGRIDVLFNNAGSAVGGFFEDLHPNDIHAQFETNFFGVQNVIREVLPLMRSQKGGLIINMSSISGLYALPGFGAYNASKWALEGFSESLYYELKPFNIRVCLIEPGAYKTKIFFENRHFARDFDNPQSPYYAMSQYMKEKVDIRVKRDKKNPEDIARLVEKLIASKNPPFRNIPDFKSRMLFLTRKILPFNIFSSILYRLLMSRYKQDKNF